MIRNDTLQAGYADKIADVWAQVASETSVYAKQSN